MSKKGISGAGVRCYKEMMIIKRKIEKLRDQYRHGGFTPMSGVETASWDKGAKILRLNRRSKKQFAVAVKRRIEAGTTGVDDECETCRVGTPEFF